MAACRRRARARVERPEAGERRWRRRWVKRAWEKECCGRWPAAEGRRWMDKEPSGAVRRARRVWWGHEASAAATQPASSGASWPKAAWAARRTGDGDTGQAAQSARRGARKGSRARVGSESAKEPRKDGAARRAGSGKLTPPSEARRRS